MPLRQHDSRYNRSSKNLLISARARQTMDPRNAILRCVRAQAAPGRGAQGERETMHDRAHRGAMVLVACAMAFGFAWFDLPGHGASYVARSVAMGSAVTDGHTLFLWGMLAVTLLMAARPQLFERHLCPWLGIGWVLGTASLGAFSVADSPWASAVAVAVTGFADVLCINLVIGLVLTRLCDRTQQMTAVALALAAKTLLVYGSDRFLGQTAQTALSIAVPTLCVACALGAQRLMGLSAGEEAARGANPGHIKLAPPLSTLMLGMLFVASVIFATTRVVSPIGFWGTDYPLSSWDPVTRVGTHPGLRGAVLHHPGQGQLGAAPEVSAAPAHPVRALRDAVLGHRGRPGAARGGRARAPTSTPSCTAKPSCGPWRCSPCASSPCHPCA